MNMKKYRLIFSSIFLAIMGFSCTFGAQGADQAAGDSGWYLGAGVGVSTESGLDGIDTTLAGYGITSSSTVSGTPTAWKVFGGYQVNKYFGVEGAYADLGQFTINSSVTPAGTGTATWQPNNVWSLSAVGYLPIMDQFSAFGKLGVAYSNVNFTYSDTNANAISVSNTTTSPLYGLGLKYDFTDHASVRGEFERYQNLGDSSVTGQSSVNVWSLGLQYHF